MTVLPLWGVGGVLSGNTFNNLCVGGLNKEGGSAANDLEMLIMESAMTCATPQPTLSLLYDEKLPEEFLLKGIECTKIGTGYPAWVNNRVAMEFLLKNFRKEGMDLEEAKAWSNRWLPGNFCRELDASGTGW